MHESPIVYDNLGRMQYNPIYHKNIGKIWKRKDIKYLKEWYYIIGPTEMSFALERTIQSVMQMVVKSIRNGEMLKPKKITNNNKMN